MVQLWEKVAAVPSLPAPPPLHGGFQSSAHLASLLVGPCALPFCANTIGFSPDTSNLFRLAHSKWHFVQVSYNFPSPKES